MSVSVRATWLAVAACALACGGHRGASGGAAPARGAGAAPGEAAPLAAALARGDSALRDGRTEEAREAYAAAAALAPHDPAPQLGLARAALALRRLPDAASAADRAVALRRSTQTLLVRGLALAHSRRFDEAAADLEAAVGDGPDAGEAWALLSCVQVNRGDDVEAAWAFAGAERTLGKDGALERVWTLLTAIPPDPVQPQEALDRCMRGAAARLQGRWVEANHEQVNGMRYSSTFEWCVAGMAEVASRAGDLKLAEGLLRRAIARYPPRLDALRADAQGRLAAVLLDGKKDPAEAAALARAALATRGDRAAVLLALGRACDASGDDACARDAYVRLLARPHVPEETRSHATRRLEALGGGR